MGDDVRARLGETRVVASADRCTVHPQHVMVNQGRDEARYGDVWRCACGKWDLGYTDEHRARYGGGA